MKCIIFIYVLFLAGLPAYSQSQFENPGFEEWEDLDLPQPEPVNWSSIKTSRANPPYLNNSAPLVWWQSEDAHSGNYSVMLKNIYVSLIDKVATGTITNGRVNTELLPSGRVLQRLIQGPRRHAARRGGDRRPQAVQRHHPELEALTGSADQVIGRNRALLERDLAERVRLAHDLRADEAEPFRIGGHQETGDPPRAGLRLRAGEHRVDIGEPRVRDQRLLSRQHP